MNYEKEFNEWLETKPENYEFVRDAMRKAWVLDDKKRKGLAVTYVKSEMDLCKDKNDE